MAWPKHEYIDCIGFPRNYLPLVIRAIDERMVVWGRAMAFAESVSSSFIWAGCVWEVDEFSEYIASIRLVSGTLDSEALTAAILKGTIDNS